MHILYLVQYFTPPDGIGGSRAFGIARAMLRAGHRVTMITSSASFPDRYEFDRPVTEMRLEGIDLRIIDVQYSNLMSYPQRIKAFFAFALRAVREMTRVADVDVIFATSTPLTTAIPAILARCWHRKPMVFEVRDLWPEVPIAMGALRNPALKWAARWLERRAYSNAAHVIALSPGMKDGIVRSG
ncbi:MAG: glycosyltransferase, partial [Elusimicrobiota bacterium]